MFTIKSTQLMEWPALNFTLRKGENALTSRKAVPPELWPKLERFRTLKLLDFEGEAKPGGEDDHAKLAELTQAQIYAMSKDDLAELAKREGVTVADGAKKKALLDALVAKLAKVPDPAPPAEGKAGGEPAEAALTAEGLGKLSFEELKGLADANDVDVEGLRSKQQIVDKLLGWMAAGTSPPAAG